MVSSRSSYNLTFDSSALDEGEDENEAILRLIQLCQDQGVSWVDNLPITKTAPFSYTFTSLTELSDTQRNRFTTFLRDQLEVIPEDATAEDITADYLSSRGPVRPRAGGADAAGIRGARHLQPQRSPQRHRCAL